MTLTPIEIFLYGGLLTVIGWGVGHRLATKRDLIARKAIEEREAELRRRYFRRFIRKCRYTLERTPHTMPQIV